MTLPQRFFVRILTAISLCVTLTTLYLFSVRSPKGPASPTYRADRDTRVRYDGHQLLRLNLTNTDQVNLLASVAEQHAFDVWTPMRLGSVDVRLPPGTLRAFQELIPGIPFKVVIRDLQRLVDDQGSVLPLNAPSLSPSFPQDGDQGISTNPFYYPPTRRPYPPPPSNPTWRERGQEGFFFLPSSPSPSPNLNHLSPQSTTSVSSTDFFKAWRPYGDYVSLLRSLISQNPSVTEEMDLGATYEGRRILGIRIGMLNAREKWRKKRRTIVLVGGQHAREWVSGAVAAWIATAIIKGHQTDDRRTRRLLEHFDFLIIPILNPDGYEYSHTTDRMWRKNRQPTGVEYCIGTDLNHNWAHRWASGASSSNPCSDTFHGAEAFSAPEARQLARLLRDLSPQPIALIDLHAYGQLWMYPFAADCDAIPRDNEDLVEAALLSSHALRSAHGSRFEVGSACGLLFRSDGGLMDWAYVESSLKYAYELELRDLGQWGFLLPISQVPASGQEVWKALDHLGHFILNREKL